MAEDYKKNSITLAGAVSVGSGVMIGAGTACTGVRRPLVMRCIETHGRGAP